MPVKEKHIHKLRRHKYKTGAYIFFCTLPDCHFKVANSLALGKRSLCWRCGEQFVLNEYSIRLAKPHCENCHKTKKELHIDNGNISEVTANIHPPMTLVERMNKLTQTESHEEEDI